MKASSFLRLSVLAAALGSAMAAHAIDLSVASVGTFTQAANVVTFNESVIYQATNPMLAAFDTVTLTLDANTLGGTALFRNAANTQTMGIRYHIAGYSLSSPVASGSGTWTLTSGTGDYAGKTGSGTITQNGFLNGRSSISSFQGTLQAVPEPASMAALALGAAGLLRRRRKA